MPLRALIYAFADLPPLLPSMPYAFRFRFRRMLMSVSFLLPLIISPVFYFLIISFRRCRHCCRHY